METQLRTPMSGDSRPSHFHKHLNFLGRYHFSLPGDVRGGVLRELRDPNAGLEEQWLLPVGSP